MLRGQKADRTVFAYGRWIERATAFMRTRRKTLRSATWKDWREFADTLPYTHATRMGLQCALKAYWRFLGRSDCPAWAIPTPRKPRRFSRALSTADVKAAFLAAAAIGPTVVALVACLYYLGIRREDVARLRWEQFQKDGRLHLVGKGGVERYVPVRPEVMVALEELPRTSEYVFPGRWGGHIALGTVNHWITIVSEVSGVSMTPHRFRHTAITKGYDATKDILAVQAFAGHADVRTTRDYIETPWNAVVAVTAGL
jgi:integrase